MSVTSLQVPNGARKEFEKGEKRTSEATTLIRRHNISGESHAEYDKYAAAWNELGNLYATTKENEKSQQVLKRPSPLTRINIPPYLGLAQLELQDQKFELSVKLPGKLFALDASVGDANFIQAIGNFKLNRLDAAEKSAQKAKKGPPQEHVGFTRPACVNSFAEAGLFGCGSSDAGLPQRIPSRAIRRSDEERVAKDRAVRDDRR